MNKKQSEILEQEWREARARMEVLSQWRGALEAESRELRIQVLSQDPVGICKRLAEIDAQIEKAAEVGGLLRSRADEIKSRMFKARSYEGSPAGMRNQAKLEGQGL